MSRLIDADKIPWTDLNDNPNSNIKVLVTFAEKVNRMPTIEERKKGKWISDMDDEPVVIKDGSPDKSCHCSECGEWLVASDEYDVKGNFCPNCGADMRGET